MWMTIDTFNLYLKTFLALHSVVHMKSDSSHVKRDKELEREVQTLPNLIHKPGRSLRNVDVVVCFGKLQKRSDFRCPFHHPTRT